MGKFDLGLKVLDFYVIFNCVLFMDQFIMSVLLECNNRNVETIEDRSESVSHR